jgi:CRP-like cAMP-binding protein
MLLPSAELDWAPVEFLRRDTLPAGRQGLWQIQQGLVRSVTWDEDGNPITLGLWGVGQVVGKALTLIEPHELQCLTDVSAVEIDRGLPQLSLQLLQQIQMMEQLLSITRTRRLPYRLVKLLQWLGSRFGTPCESGWLISRASVPLTHQLLSELVGATRVTVTRILGVLTERELYSRREQHLFVRQLRAEEFFRELADWTDVT